MSILMMSSNQMPSPWLASTMLRLPHLAQSFDCLDFHSLVDPPMSPKADAASPGAIGIWASRREPVRGDGQLLTSRHLAVQALQVKIEVLAGPAGQVNNEVLRLFVNGQLNHIYVGTDDFIRLAEASGVPPVEVTSQPIFLDEEQACVVIDTQRSFHRGKTVLTAAAIAALLRMTESPRFGVRLLQCLQPGVASEATRMTCRRLLAGTREVIRHALGEEGLVLSEDSSEMLRQIGKPTLARAAFAGLIDDVEALGTVCLPEQQPVC